jgi:hypothetical protein
MSAVTKSEAHGKVQQETLKTMVYALHVFPFREDKAKKIRKPEIK